MDEHDFEEEEIEETLDEESELTHQDPWIDREDFYDDDEEDEDASY